MKKALASDFDGTIFFREIKTHDTNFLPEDLEAIQKFQKNGGLFGICTGRPLHFITLFTDKAGIQFDFYILTTGAVILDKDKKTIQETYINQKDFQKIYRKFQDMTIFTHADYTLYPNNKEMAEQYGAIYAADETFFKEKNIQGVSLQCGTEERASKCVAYIKETFESVEAFQNITSVDIVAKGCSKGAGVQKIKEYYNIDQIGGIGDSFNDIPLLDASDISYTFHHCKEQIGEHADILVHNVAEALGKMMG